MAKVPEASRGLFFRPYGAEHYYSLRFMGVFLNDPDTGDVIAQFPHFLPASMTLGYAIGGLRGETTTVVVGGVLGILSVSFFLLRLSG